MATTAKSALTLTVGSGNPKDPEGTLYQPLLKSIREGSWDKVVFLPSIVTEENARELERRLSGTAVEIIPLPGPNDENDVDSCFAHFDRVIQKLRTEGFDAVNVCADFTRGTKAMSAALVLAAIRHGVPRIRYVEGDRDPARQNNVIPGTERVRTVEPQVATASIWLDRARAFLMDGDFVAVLGVLPDVHQAATSGWPNDLLPILGAVRTYAEFYSAWDRLDYSAAVTQGEGLPNSSPDGWDDFAPRPAALEWVRELARDSPKKGGIPLPSDKSGDMVVHARRVMVDLLANGRRRIRNGQFEDANLRSYRIAEMLGQTRLFYHGLDSSFLDPQNPVVAKLEKDLAKGGSSPFGSIARARQQYLTAAREQTFRLLSRLNDPLWEKLKSIGPDVESRNHSILVHGFDRLADLDAQRLAVTYDRLEALLREDLGSVAEKWLLSAHFHKRFFRH
jgi:CRISPR-associated protein (TIGR02710 family)